MRGWITLHMSANDVAVRVQIENILYYYQYDENGGNGPTNICFVGAEVKKLRVRETAGEIDALIALASKR